MRLYAYLLQCLGLLALLAAAANTENYNVVVDAASYYGKQLQEGVTYAVYEYWHPVNRVENCFPGFSHARLVVGEIKKTRNNRDYTFDGTAYDLLKEGGIFGGIHGGTTSVGKEKWKPNQYKNRNGDWQRVSAPSQYEYAGEVAGDVDSRMIKRLGDEWCRQHPTYNVVTNNCVNFVEDLYRNIHN
ncbi:hypothetical protein Hte_002689 [Hypoxylon texense]